MKLKIAPAAQKIAYFLAAVYFTSYCMRVNLAVMLVKICSEMKVEKSELAIVITVGNGKSGKIGRAHV